VAAVATLVYDGDCGFCTRSARWLQRRARSLDIVPWQRADLESLGLTADECQAAVQCVGGGRRSSGALAVAAALRECRQPYRAVGSVVGSPAVRPLADRVYVWVAAHRHRLPGGTRTCAMSVPDSTDADDLRVGDDSTSQHRT
jgi:predicted DCC family thiol-disulfide oxidoreductase YuxK